MATATKRDVAICEITGKTEDDGRQHYLHLEVYFSKGGVNWFNGKELPKGYAFSFCKRERSPSTFGNVCYVMDGRSNPSRIIAPAGRFSAKRLKEAAVSVLYPTDEMDEMLSGAYAKCREQWPEAEFPEIEPGKWRHMIPLYR